MWSLAQCSRRASDSVILQGGAVLEPVTLEVVLLRPGAKLPAQQTTGASGFDLHACLDGGTLEVGASPVRVPTGIAIAAPHGSDVQVRPRSGLSVRGVMGVLG